MVVLYAPHELAEETLYEKQGGSKAVSGANLTPILQDKTSVHVVDLPIWVGNLY